VRLGSAPDTTARARDLLSRRQRDPGRRIIADVDARDFRVGADFHAAGSRGGRERRRQRARPRSEPSRTNRMSFAGAEQQQDCRAAGGPGARNDPVMPPAAIVARSGSLSNHSPTRSATAIGM